MRGAGRHARPQWSWQTAEPAPGRLTRLGVTTAVAAVAAVVTIVAAVLTVSAAPASVGRASDALTRQAGRPGAAGASARASAPGSAARSAASLLRGVNEPGAPRTASAPAASAASAASGGRAAVPLTLTAADYRDCPAAATACVDLARHLTWLQSGGRVTFGPVTMEPGKPGSAHQTPRGTFRVEWKAGTGFVSSIYHETMAWATFFGGSGIAFHGGSLTQWSHGCVHLTVANARYYNEHLPVGAEVVVF
jgi:lipoprotein-anchoring transpeptidase ErfK/SrfK